MSENGLHKIPNMRTALEAIQELHGRDTWGRCLHCNGRDGWSIKFPCKTRRLADQGLGGGQHE